MLKYNTPHKIPKCKEETTRKAFWSPSKRSTRRKSKEIAIESENRQVKYAFLETLSKWGDSVYSMLYGSSEYEEPQASVNA